MRSSGGFSRMYRRTIIKHFGSTKNFIVWTTAVILTIYVIDTFVLTRDRLQSFLVEDGSQNVVAKDKRDSSTNQHDKGTNKQPEGNAVDKPPSSQDEAKLPKATPLCGLPEACPEGQYAYFVRSGYGRDTSPSICFNGEKVFPDRKAGERGINLVVINDKSMAVEDVRSFDTYSAEDAMIRFLQLGVGDHFIVIAATQDEATFRLTKDGRQWLELMGSAVIEKLGFRDNMVMIGQRGLEKGKAIEKHAPRETGKEFADTVEVQGCLTVPMGKLTASVAVKGVAGAAAASGQEGVKLGEELPNCGVQAACGAGAFPVHVFSGVQNKEGPKICVSGKYVIAKGLNDGGRGLNVAVVDPKTKDVVRVGHFDTYAEDSSNLEIFLEMLNEKEIVVAVTHDDASKNLHLHAQKLLESLGAWKLKTLGFRDAWGFIGQMGIDGITTLEKIEFVPPTGDWPRSIDMKVCVPTELKGSQIKPDPLANKNEKRRTFCSKYDGYGEFCETEHVDEALVPAPLTDKALEKHRIFTVPIIVIPGLNHNAVRMQLETLLMNPGIQPGMVSVLYDEKFAEPAALAELFGFKAASLSSSTKYIYQMEKALEKVWELYPKAEHVVVLEEEVIPSQDLLSFLAQCLPALEADATLAGISAWNENGYQGVSSLPEVAYRANTMPGLGFLLKRSFYEGSMKGKMSECCHFRAWDGWFQQSSSVSEMEMIVPDTSRVFRRPYEGLSEQADFLKQLFNRLRVTNVQGNAKVSNAAALVQAKYEAELEKLLGSATALATSNAPDCFNGKGLGFYIPQQTGKSFAVFYEQAAVGDYSILKQLCKCFGLFYAPEYEPRGLHKGMLRFSIQGNTVMFVGSQTPYAKFMPSGYSMIKLSQLPTS